jgi:ABC-2 type transport system permease protein
VVGCAFVRRGVATYLSYRAKVSLAIVSLSLSMLTFALVGRVVDAAGPGFAQRYGVDYASFAILGVAVHSVASAGLGCFRSALRREQLQGTLEALLAGRLPVQATVCLSGLGELAFAAVGGVCFIGLARLLPGVSVTLTATGCAAVCAYGLFMCGLGLASAGFILVSKEGEPVSWLFGAASGLLGGVYFPVDLMPTWLQHIARALPTAHALSLIRGSRASGLDAGGAHSMLVLVASAVLAVTGGLMILSWGFARARRLGTLGEY